MAKDDKKYSRDDQAARTRSAEVGKGKSASAGLNAKNPMSSAKGPYQMLDSTWKDMEKLAGHDLDRKSQEDNELAFQLYTKRSEKALEQNGLEVNPGNTYALHVYGPKGGVDFLKKIKANPNGLAIEGMPKAVIDGNKPFFYDDKGKPRTNSDSYNTLSTRVGGPNDPGAITLSKNIEREQAIEQQQNNIALQQQQAQQAQEEQAQNNNTQDPNQVQEEQATDPNQVQNQQQAPVIDETSQLSRASNKAGVLYSGNRSSDANFILPTEPVQEDIKTSGESVQKMKTFAFGGVYNTLNKSIDPPFPKIKSTAETLTGANIPATRTPIIGTPYVAPKSKTIDDLYGTYHSIADKKLDTLTRNDMIRKSGENIVLREGRSKGRVVDKSLLNAIDDAEKRNKLKRGDIASLIKREEDFRHEPGSSTYDLRDVSNYYKVNSAVTGLDPLRYLADRKVPGVKMTNTKMGSQFERVDDDQINKHLASHPKMAAEYEKLLSKSVPVIGKKNTLDFIARDLKAAGSRDKFIKQYNPGDPNYSRMVAEDAAQLAKEPEYNKYLDSRRKLASNGISNARDNKLAYGGDTGTDTTLSGDNDGLLNEFNEGGSHEENPNGGVMQGVSSDGVPNTVEEGETKMGNYVFSNRLTLDKADVNNLYLPRETEGMTYAEASKFINNFLEENPFDFIVKRTVTGQLESLKIGNDRARRYKEEEEQLVTENEVKKETRDNPELQESVLSQMNIQSAQPENSSIEEENAQENQSGQQQYNFGGYIAARDRRWLANGGFTSGDFNPQDSIGWEYKKPALNNFSSSIESQSPTTEAGVTGNIGGIAGAASTGIGMGMDAFKKFNTSDVNAQDIQKVGVGGAMAKGAAEGALAGASLGPYGALAGAAVGGILGGIGAGNQNKAANKQAINKSDYAFNKASIEIPESRVSKYGGNMKRYALGGNNDPIKPSWITRSLNEAQPGSEGFSAQSFTRQLENLNNFDPNKPLYAPDALGFANRSMAPKYQLATTSPYSKKLQESINTQTALNGTSNSPVQAPKFEMKGNNVLQYAEGVGSLMNYLNARKDKPRTIRSEELHKLSSPKYYDESYLQTQLGKEANNLSQAALATSGGSDAAARATYLAGSSGLNKLKSDAYFKMDEVNRAVYDKDQAEQQRIADTNVGLRNQDYQANLQEEDYTRARKEMARDNLIKSVGAIGREQSDRNLIYNLTGGYRPDGTYDPENKQGLWNRGVDLYSKIKGQRSKGGLIDAYEKATTMDDNEKALDYLNKKYNGKI